MTEGVVANYDGGAVEDPHYAHVRSDFNRNFPSTGWRPYDWQGHGNTRSPNRRSARSASSSTITRTSSAPSTSTPARRPSSTRALAGEDPEFPSDADLFEEVGRIGEEITGFPYVWGYGERTGDRSPGQYLPGSFKEFVYDRLGIPVFLLELGMFSDYLGPDAEESLRADRERERIRRLLAYQDENPDCDLFHEWEPHDHPELGEVEIGGLDKTTRGNPPAEEMPAIAADVTEFVLRFAAYRPDVRVAALDAATWERTSTGSPRRSSTAADCPRVSPNAARPPTRTFPIDRASNSPTMTR